MIHRAITPLAGLVPNPRNLEIYGEPQLDDDFLKSIMDEGVLEIPVVTEIGDDEPGMYMIISGHRRIAALKFLHDDLHEIVVDVDSNYQDLTDLEKAGRMIEYNRHRVKTASMLAYEARYLAAREQERADARKKSGKKVPKKEKGTTRDKVGEQLGMSGRNVDRLTKVQKEAEAGNKVAQEQMEKLDNGETTVGEAYKEVQKDSWQPAPPAKVEQWINVGDQVRMVDEDPKSPATVIEVFDDEALIEFNDTKIQRTEPTWCLSKIIEQEPVPEHEPAETQEPIAQEEKQDTRVEQKSFEILTDPRIKLLPEKDTALPKTLLEHPFDEPIYCACWYTCPSDPTRPPERDYARQPLGMVTGNRYTWPYEGVVNFVLRNAKLPTFAGHEKIITKWKVGTCDNLTTDQIMQLRLFGMIEEENDYTLSLFWRDEQNHPHAALIDAHPCTAAQIAIRILSEEAIIPYRIHYSDRNGAAIDITEDGLIYLAGQNRIEEIPDVDMTPTQKKFQEQFADEIRHVARVLNYPIGGIDIHVPGRITITVPQMLELPKQVDEN